jgi:hypothetical protein
MSKKNKDDTRAAPKLVKIAGELHAIFKREATDVVNAGRLLKQAKKEVGHGNFFQWLKEEFSLSEKTAERYMAAHEFWVSVVARFRGSDKLSELRIRRSALYELAERHSAGTITDADIEAILKEATNNWVGQTKLQEILSDRQAVEPTAEVATEGAQAHRCSPLVSRRRR